MTSKKRKYNNQRRSTQLTMKSRIQLFYYCLPAILFEFIPTWEPFKKSDWSFGSLQSYLGNEKSFKPIFFPYFFFPKQNEWEVRSNALDIALYLHVFFLFQDHFFFLFKIPSHLEVNLFCAKCHLQCQRSLISVTRTKKIYWACFLRLNSFFIVSNGRVAVFFFSSFFF